MSIFSFFKKSIKPVQSNASDKIGNEIYFHEDLFCQVEFVPRENIARLADQNNTISGFSEKHFDGIGYTDIYERDNHHIPITKRNIKIDDLDKCLSNHGFVKADIVYYGYASQRIKCENTNAYRFNKSDMFFEYKNNIVTAFWINGFRFISDESEKLKIKDVLLAIGTKYNLVLNDWDLCVTVDLHHEVEILKYLNEEFDI